MTNPLLADKILSLLMAKRYHTYLLSQLTSNLEVDIISVSGIIDEMKTLNPDWYIVESIFNGKDVNVKLNYHKETVIKDFINKGGHVAHQNKFISNEIQKEKDRRLDGRVKTSGIWTGWLTVGLGVITIVISIVLVRSCH